MVLEHIWTIFEKHTAPGAYSKHAPGAVLMSNMVLEHIWTIFEKHTAPGAYSKHAPGAVLISNKVLEHIWLRVFFKIINGPGHKVLMVQDPFYRA